MTPQGQTGLLVAYDDTASARRAAEFAADRAERTGEDVHVVHIGTDLTAREVRDAVEDAFAGRDVVLTVEVVAAGGSDDANVSVSTKLGEIIHTNDFSMVVMGNEKHGLFHGLTEASVTEALIEGQAIPILLVP